MITNIKNIVKALLIAWQCFLLIVSDSSNRFLRSWFSVVPSVILLWLESMDTWKEMFHRERLVHNVIKASSHLRKRWIVFVTLLVKSFQTQLGDNEAEAVCVECSGHTTRAVCVCPAVFTAVSVWGPPTLCHNHIIFLADTQTNHLSNLSEMGLRGVAAPLLGRGMYCSHGRGPGTPLPCSLVLTELALYHKHSWLSQFQNKLWRHLF